MQKRKRFTEREVGGTARRAGDACGGATAPRRAGVAGGSRRELGLTAPELRESAYNLVHYLRFAVTMYGRFRTT